MRLKLEERQNSLVAGTEQNAVGIDKRRHPVTAPSWRFQLWLVLERKLGKILSLHH